MPSTINASTASGGGIISSADSSGVLELQTAGTTAIAISSAQAVTIQGLTVGRGAGAIASNTATGVNALNANTTGAQNAAYGNDALLTNQTGANLAAFGFRALRVNTASSNSAFGAWSLVSNTTGANNTAVGQDSLYSNTTASNNTAVGFQAAFSTTTGIQVTAIGAGALYNNTAQSNTGVGYFALRSNTSGSNNVAVGADAGGAFCTLQLNTTGSFNTAVGNGALGQNTTASESTAVGYKAGYSNTTSGGGTFVGYEAGLNSTGAANTFFGNSAGALVTSGAKNTIIGRFNGNQNGLDIRTANNYIVLSDGDGNVRAFHAGANGGWSLGEVLQSSSVYNVNISSTGGRGTLSSIRYGSDGTHIQFTNSAGNSAGNISVSGTTTSYNATSDYRLKEDVKPMENAIEKLSNLRPVTFTWKQDKKAGQGFIAHELAEVFPDAVHGEKDAVNEDGKIEPQGVDTSYLVATLVKAIQELKAEVDSLKAQLENK